jgi:nitroimidazol reductase NimA-like FMN-containing flavoprotein (pyridoxamine 5'-phosphate oxidase superfamily)
MRRRRRTRAPEGHDEEDTVPDQFVPPGGAELEELSLEECLAHLRAATVGRIAVVVDDAPMLLPVNFRFVEEGGHRWLVLKTRPGNVIDRGALIVAFEIDEIDASRREGWSVVVRGTLGRLDPDSGGLRERFDPDSWLAGRDSWLVIEPFAITGRRLVAPDRGWAFDERGYL